MRRSASDATGMPRVLHVVWNLIRGGTEGQCARVAMHLARMGGLQRVAVFRREGFFLHDVEKICGPVHTLDIHRMVEWRSLQEVRKLVRILRTEQIDVVHAWDADAAIFGGWAARWAGVPLITSRRDLGEIYPNWKLRLMRRADRRARAVVANAEAIKERLVQDGARADALQVIPNVLDVEEFDALAQQPLSLPNLPERPCVVLVARLDPEKDVDVFIEAAAQLSKRRADLNFLIAGDGRERARLEALVAQGGVGDRVRFLGEFMEVPALLKTCTIGVLTPKSNEGLSNTILEYMAAGMPVVATDCGGNRELVTDGMCGLIVPVGDVAATVLALEQLLGDPEEAVRMGKAGRRLIEERHRPECVAAQFLELYRAVPVR